MELCRLSITPQFVKVKAFRIDKYSAIAQLVERLAVNEDVPGSSPGRGAKTQVSCYTKCCEKINYGARYFGSGRSWGLFPLFQ